MAVAVLDASALLAYLQAEPGADRVRGILDSGTAAVSAVNMAEVLSKLVDAGASLADAQTRLHVSGLLPHALELHTFDEASARDVADLRPVTRDVGLSVGDRACIGLGRRLGLPVLTADRAWATLTLPGVRIELIRP